MGKGKIEKEIEGKDTRREGESKEDRKKRRRNRRGRVNSIEKKEKRGDGEEKEFGKGYNRREGK